MKQKNLMSQMVNAVNPITIQDLSTEVVELSEEDLQQVVGGLRITITPIRRPISIGFPRLRQGWQ